jgi:hypothetical protein
MQCACAHAEQDRWGEAPARLYYGRVQPARPRRRLPMPHRARRPPQCRLPPMPPQRERPPLARPDPCCARGEPPACRAAPARWRGGGGGGSERRGGVPTRKPSIPMPCACHVHAPYACGAHAPCMPLCPHAADCMGRAWGACLLKASKSCLTAAGASMGRGSPSTYSSRCTHAASASGGNCFTW